MNIDVQEGVLNRKTGDYIAAVYSADVGAGTESLSIDRHCALKREPLRRKVLA
jgi:hypothetical protein